MQASAGVGARARRIAVGALIACAAAARAEDPAGAGSAAGEALAICQRADRAPVEDRAALLAFGLERAEAAVRADPRDAAAHLAVFCNLGKQLRTRGAWRLLSSFGDITRARNELDIALTLSPDFPGALAAKGQMLAELPRWLGGDRDEALRLLRRAVELAPGDARLRLMLASALREAGRRDEARIHALAALGTLERNDPDDELATARTLVTSLQ
jgi:tetratricopeptide (TPR) repeat protein